MEKLEYKPFDYFETPIDEFRYRYSECDSYGINQLDVIKYVDTMRKDREKWERKASSVEICGIILQVIVTLFFPILPIAVKIYIFRWLDIDMEGMEDSIIIDVIAGFIAALWIGFGWGLWKKNYVVLFFNRCADYRYKKKTQYNSLIEKFLEDSHWDYYQVKRHH